MTWLATLPSFSVEEAFSDSARRAASSPEARAKALATRKRNGALHGLFTPAEQATHKDPKKLRQPAASLDEVYRANEKVAPLHKRVLEAVGKELGGGLVSQGHALREGHKKGLAFVGPLKTRERATDKITNDYGGDAGQITDIVRGSVSVPHVDHVAGAVSTLRKHAHAYGFEMVKPKNRFAYQAGSRTHRGTDSSGYRDANVLLRHKDSGVLTEVQIHAHHFHAAKEEAHGHYVQHSELIRQHGDAPPAHIVKRLRSLEKTQRKLYSAAKSAAYSDPVPSLG